MSNREQRKADFAKKNAARKKARKNGQTANNRAMGRLLAERRWVGKIPGSEDSPEGNS